MRFAFPSSAGGARKARDFLTQDRGEGQKQFQLSGIRSRRRHDLPAGKRLLSAGKPYLFTSGVGSILASKVGSFLASAEVGLMTPVVSVIACVFDLLSLLVPVTHTDMRFIVLSSLNAAAIALLGPGAYSLDARLFGRRVIVFRSDGRPARH